MKKLMVMLAAVAMSTFAMAADVFGFITVYEKDSSPADANGSWYSCYFMDLDTIKAATGNTLSSVDCDTYAAWLQANFASNVATTKSNASLVMTPGFTAYKSNYNQYQFKYEATGFGQSKDFLAVCFFDNDTDHAFKISKHTDSIYQFDDSNYDGTTVWIAAPASENVPEPTSGLMLLLGLAGLALKRKMV